MDLVDVLLLNLAVQLCCVLACAGAIRKMHPHGPFLVFFDADDEFVHWQPDPLTQTFTELRDARKEIASLKESTAITNLKKEFVTREEFAPVQRVVYGMVGLTLMTALASVLVLVMRTGTGK